MKRVLGIILFIAAGTVTLCIAQSGRVKNALPDTDPPSLPNASSVSRNTAVTKQAAPEKGSKAEVYGAKEVDTKAVILSRPQAVFAYKARSKNVTGTVSLRLVLAANGKVTDIEVLEGLPHGLTENAIKAARQIKFTPATKNGRPVSQRAQVNYVFTIGD